MSRIPHLSPDRTMGAWRVIVPVKRHALAKSRLVAPEGVSRPALAQAMARDTVLAAAAAVGASSVLVVTSDEAMLRWARGGGIGILQDPGQGLNEAASAGLATVPTKPVAVLLGDLPSLRSAELRDALIECARHPIAFVPDRDGAGTVLLTSTGPTLAPRFGPSSARRHEDVLAAVRLELPYDGLRQDVDDNADLAAAIRLGVGAHTRSALAGPEAPTVAAELA